MAVLHLPYYHEVDLFLTRFVRSISNILLNLNLTQPHSTSLEQSTDSVGIGEGLLTTGSCSAKSKMEIDEYGLVAGSDLTSASQSIEEATGQ
jgi:hypothetical protein